MTKLAIALITLLIGLSGGIIIGVLIDKDYYIKGKLKQKGGRGSTQSATSNLQLKKQSRKERRKQRKLNKNK